MPFDFCCTQHAPVRASIAQASTETLIRKQPFSRLVREISQNVSRPPVHSHAPHNVPGSCAAAQLVGLRAVQLAV